MLQEQPKMEITHTYHSSTRSQRNKKKSEKKRKQKRKKTSLRAATHKRDVYFFSCSFLPQLSEAISASARFPPST